MSSKTPFKDLGIDDKVILVEEALEVEIFPYIRSHGGGIEILDIEDTTVQIAYYGTCGGCPLSTTGTLQLIQGVLQEKVDPEILVDIVEDGLHAGFY